VNHNRREIEAEQLEADLALTKAELAAALWQRPLIADSQVHVALDMALSSWHALKAEGGAPPTIAIGRRVYVRTADLRAWLDARPARVA